MDSLHWDWQDFIDAIEAIPNSSPSGPDGVPAIIMKKGKSPIGRILIVIFRTTIETGKIPEFFKLAYITGIFKSGSRTEPPNYRPISLTSHVVRRGCLEKP